MDFAEGGLGLVKKKSPHKTKAIGWNDWKSTIAMFIFAGLMIVSLYTGLEVLKYIAILPAMYGLLRAFSQVLE